MGGLSGAAQYVRLIAEWRVTGEVETLRCFRWAAYVADEGVLIVGHELFLTQFEAGESISEVPSIIRAIFPVDLRVSTERGLENAN